MTDFSFPLNNHPARLLEQEPEETLEEVVYHPDDDPAALRGIPVFKPTFEQFKVSALLLLVHLLLTA